ncbi:hypothetical protein KQH27_00880, partial [bacterium]|nr:hypothetical protein [bacterium]
DRRTAKQSEKLKEEFGEISGKLHSGWDYYLGVADIPKEDCILHPFLLPIFPDGEIGHFILILECTTPSSWNMYGELSDRQYLVKYNPNCGGMESDAVAEVLHISNYIVTPPKLAVSEIRASYTDWLQEEPNNPSLQKSLENDINTYYEKLITDFRHETGVIISAIGQLDRCWKEMTLILLLDNIGFIHMNLSERILEITEKLWIII